MSWYYTTLGGGKIFEATGAGAAATNADILVQTHDPVPGQITYGPFATQADAQAAQTAHPPVSLNPVSGVASDVETIVGQYFLRAFEAVLGIVLIAIALNAVLKQTTGINPIGAAKSAAVKAGTVAAVA